MTIGNGARDRSAAILSAYMHNPAASSVRRPDPLGWAAFGLLCGFAIWRIATLGMADHYARSGEADRAAQALEWRDSHPLALEKEGRRMQETSPAEALGKLAQAVAAGPTRGSAYATMGSIWERSGHAEEARKAVDTAVRLAPARVDVRLIAAASALARNDAVATLAHWSAAMTRRPALQRLLFPDLLRMAETPVNRPAFALLLADATEWWPDFVRFAAASAGLEVVSDLYALSQSQPANALPPDALAAVLRRLKREGLWTDARLAWMETLPPQRLDGMGNIFNGDFEHDLSDLGFDWIREPAGHVVVERSATDDAGGDHALRVLFRGPRVRFRHLSQHLTLPPGSYLLHGRAKGDGLEAAPGLMWTVSCIGAAERPIAATRHFAGRFPWQRFEAEVLVPKADCPAQVLRLQLDGRTPLDFEAKGSIWFDDLSMERTSLH